MFNDFRTDYTSGDATWEILIMLLVAFILGWLFHHFLCCKSKKHVERDNRANTTAQGLTSAATAPVSVAPAAKVVEKTAPTAAVKAKPVAAATSTSEKDDLKKVEGIGPKIEGLLNAAGVTTWRALATTEVDFIQDVLDKAGPRYRMHNPKTWPIQSQLIEDGKWDELKEYQDFLTAGRE